MTYEAGGGGVARLDTVKAVADVLGVRAGWLAYGEGTANSADDGKGRR